MTHIIRGENSIRTSNNLLQWDTMKLADRPSNYGWAEEARDINNDVLYILYYDNNTKNIILYDKKEQTLYNISSSGKAKGYMLAFKLNNLRLSKNKN